MTVGRKPGNPGKDRAPVADSLMDQIFHLNVGEALFIECELAKRAPLSSRITGNSRYPRAMKDRRFTTQTYTAVGTKSGADIRFLLRIERTA